MPRPSKAQRILTHNQVWTALDRLAERAGMSASGLARRAGLDPTTFNTSKRITADGRERWPSTESVSKALAATNSSIDTFVQLIGDGAHRRGLFSDDHVAAIGAAAAPVGDLLDQDPVVDHEARLHRLRGDVERLEEERLDHEGEHERHRQQQDRLLPERELLALLLRRRLRGRLGGLGRHGTGGRRRPRPPLLVVSDGVGIAVF